MTTSGGLQTNAARLPKRRDHGDRMKAETRHDRKTAAAEPDLDRRDRRAVVRARGHPALAGGGGIPRPDCDPRHIRRIVAGEDRSSTARPAHAIAGLPGYADYTARVRYRLLPG